KIIDYVGGVADLEGHVIRAIGNADERFAEDRLRMLRALRFASRFAWDIDESTWRSLVHHSSAILEVSWERIQAELQAMLLASGRGRAFSMLLESGLGTVLFPEFEQVSPNALGETIGMLDMLDADSVSPELAWATLFQAIDIEALRGATKRIKLSTELRKSIETILEAQEFPAHAHQATLAELKRFLRSPNARSALTFYSLRVAIGKGESKALAFLKHELNLYEELARRGNDLLHPVPLLTGNDLIGMGLTPGPRIKGLLKELEDAQLNEKISNREEAEELMRGLIAGE
ncbi:MAG: hypothetical protein KDB07_10155, partial [Planctomycetes bacterium]|nr:hypothetical protein [Planctomycetota bacterium]